MSLNGVGVDIVEIARMRRALERTPRIRERLFSQEERAYCDSRRKPEVHYAMRFAAKEAILKAIGTGFSGMRFTDVEVGRSERGRPAPRLSGQAAHVAAELGIVEIHLSLSFTHTTAVASAVAVTASMRPLPAERPRTRSEEVDATFKEARRLVDEVDEGDTPSTMCR